MSHSFWRSFQDTCCLTFHTSTMQTPKLNKDKTRKPWYLRHFRKNATNNKNKEHWKTKTPKRRAVDENLAKHRVVVFLTKKPPKHKRHTPRGGRRTCYLVVVRVRVAAVVAAAPPAVPMVVRVVYTVSNLWAAACRPQPADSMDDRFWQTPNPVTMRRL